MKVAVMQPYIFPYLGYFQLVAAVEEFIFFDDVNFINKGWINRNTILQKDGPLRFTIPLRKASQNKLINEIQIADYCKWRDDFLKTIEHSYSKAPHFQSVFGWLNSFLSCNFSHISELAAASIKEVALLLDLSVKFSFSNEIKYAGNSPGGGQDKILEICRITGADHYINAANGIELYDRTKFDMQHIKLNFIKMEEIQYTQFSKTVFNPFLSILDVLMFNSTEETKVLLKKYELV